MAGEDLRPETYMGFWITFKKQIFGNGVQATAWKNKKPAASAGGMSKAEAFEKIKGIIRLNNK